MKATGLLKKEHKEILRALDVLENMTERVRHGETVNDHDLKGILDFLQGYAERHHQGKEEAILFPALLQDRCQKNYQELCTMIFQHNQERSLIEGLEDAIANKKVRDFIYCGAQLVRNLREHIQKEDHVLFRLADDALSEEEDSRVARELQDYERSWQEKALPTLVHRFHDIEPRYTGDTHAGSACS